VFYNREWEAIIPTLSLQALSSSLSDHRLLFLCNQQHVPRHATFQSQQFWIRIPGFYETVQAA